MPRFRETARYTVDEIQAKAREDACNNLPLPDADGPSPFERELIDANAQMAGNIVEDAEHQLQELEATIAADKELAEKTYPAEIEAIERAYEAEKALIENSPAIQHAKEQLERMDRVFQNKFAQLNRMPISHIPHWLYVILFVTIGIAEVPLNAKVFEIFGENQLNT